MPPEQTYKPGKFAQFKAWIHKHPRRTYTVIGFGLIVAASLIVIAVMWQSPEHALSLDEKPKKTTAAPVYYSPLTGEKVSNKAATTKPVTAIMLENSPDARPQSGLKDAEIVYEAVAEGGITRFLALYQQHQPETIGPVRSLRMYYVDWLTPYNASVAHVGGSYKALQTVRNGKYRDIDQFFNSSTYRRTTDRSAPHNVYTSFSKLNQLNANKGYSSSNPIPFERQDDSKQLPVQDASVVNLKISGPLYNSSYTYDPATTLYSRSQAGGPHLDREAGQIQAKVVIALRVTMNKVFEDGYREDIVTSDSGEAVVFQNGHAEKVTWSKADQEGQLTFTSTDGKPFRLARGITWISAIPNTGGDVTWQ